VFAENLAALLRRGVDVVHDLATLRYDTSWICLRASDIGAAHRRDWLFLLYLASFAILWRMSHLFAGLHGRARASSDPSSSSMASAHMSSMRRR
jgi:hypothetical protein